jgi:hypothetical protein
MSHFYIRKSYSFAETDEMMTEIKKEMSNFITKEEAEMMINRRTAIIDPNPWYRCNCESQFYRLEREIQLLNSLLEKYKNLLDLNYKDSIDKDFDEPTM